MHDASTRGTAPSRRGADDRAPAERNGADGADGRPLLSVVVPCFDEVRTVDRALDALEAFAARSAACLRLEIVAVDDASRDGSHARLAARAVESPVPMRVVRHEVNRGKGAAIRTARAHVHGDVVVIQDADLEYDPDDVPRLVAPILAGRADAVLGSRFLGAGEHRVLYFWHRVANGALTLLSNMLTNLNLTDIEAGYKAFSASAFRAMHLTRDRFGVEPEMVARLAQMGARVYEVPVSYHGRTYEDGKKITWRDGAAAVWHIVAAWLQRGSQPPLAARCDQPIAAPSTSYVSSRTTANPRAR